MAYYLFNIGWPYTDAWWHRHLTMRVITTGFDNESGDRGEHILTSLCENDWVVAYANGYGAVGAGLVRGEDTYRLARPRDLPPGYESPRHRHLRGVHWVHYVDTLDQAVAFAALRLNNKRTQTRTRLEARNGSRIVRLLAGRTRRCGTGLSAREAARVGGRVRCGRG